MCSTSSTSNPNKESTYSGARRWVLYAVCFVSISMMAGLVYGWPALRQQLQKDGSTLSESTLGAIFTVGAWSIQGGRFFVGLARDRFGTRMVASSCVVFVAVGSLGIAICDVDNAIALGISLFFIGLGSGTQLCMQPVAGLFPNTSGTVISSLSGAFHVSGLVFLALTSGNAQRKVAFSAYAACLMFLAVILFVLLPKGGSFLLEDVENHPKSVETEKEDGPQATGGTQGESELLDSTANCDSALGWDQAPEDGKETSGNNIPDEEIQPSQENNDNENDPTPTCTSPPSAMEQMKSLEYIFLCTWFSLCLTPLQYYIGSIGLQLEEKGDDDGLYTDMFAVVYAGTTIFAPVGGFLADRLGLAITQGFATFLCAFSLVFLVADSLRFQVFAMTIYSLGRLLIFGMFFSNIGKRFGYTNYGTLTGFGLLTSSLVSLFQYPLIALSADGHSDIVNIFSAALLFVQLPYFIWLNRIEKA